MSVSRHPRSRIAALAALATLALLPATARGLTARALVPASFRHKMDGMGFRWDISHNGTMSDGAHNSFNQLGYLHVNGNTFNPSQPMMTAGGEEYVLTGRTGNFVVTRRIRVDPKLSVARYVDIFRNTGAAPATASMMLRTYLGSNCQAVVTDQGSPNPSALGKKESGFLCIQQQGNRPSLLFFLAAPRSKIKPTIMSQNNYDFRYTYSFSVPAGKTVAICHAYAQRQVAGMPDAKALAALFKPFRSRKWLSDLPSDVRKAIGNLRGSLGGGAGGVMGELHTLRSLGIEPGNTDIVAFREDTRLQGKAVWSQLTLETPYGKANLPVDQVAAIVGGRRLGRRGQVFLRDGRVLSGKIVMKGFRFTMNSGLSMDLRAETLDRLVMRAKPADGQPNEKTAAYVETFEGDRLATTRESTMNFTLRTPWGQVEAPVDEIRWAKLPEDGYPGHLVALKDGSRFFAFLDGPPVLLKTITFGDVKLRPVDIRTISAPAEGKDDEGGEPDINQPHVVLAGGSVVVGRIDLPQIHLLAAGEVIPVPPSQIRTLHNLAEDDGEAPDGTAQFRAELWGGGTAVGRLRERMLPVRVGERVCQVPASDIVDVQVPTPLVPDAIRERIARLIRDLGHADWETREAATRGLEELGTLAKAQLTDAQKQSPDPEVRRRARLLIEGMKE